MPKLKRGDTLIEVLIAFSILSFVMATAFNGAMYGYKTAQVALERTQASLAVQYQIEALKTYRNSMEWSGAPSFLDGSTINSGDFKPMAALANQGSFDGKKFCMKNNIVSGNSYMWNISVDMPVCSSFLVSDLAPSLAGKSPSMFVVNLTKSPPVEVTAATTNIPYQVTVKWRPSNSSDPNYFEESTGVVVLTKN